MTRISAVILAFYCFLGAQSASALLTTSTLPEGINSPSFRFGQIDKVSERYTQDGTLMRLGDIKSIVFDSATLTRMNPDAKKLIAALNSFGKHKLGDDFNFGVLRIHTLPQVRYFAPVYARGMTSKWTLALGLPVVSYKNKISISQDYSNLEYYREQFSGLSPELDEALNLDLEKATNETLQTKGYKAIADRDESFLGDVQVASIYKFFETPNQSLIYQAMISLPTGPGYDPDDLAALNIFGRTSLTSTVAYSQSLSSRWSVVPYASYMLYREDSVVARVPLDEDDSLPDIASKQSVRRQIGSANILGSNAFYEINDRWIAGVGYERLHKDGDRYSGDRGSRYDLLSKNTQAKANRMKAEVTYSSVKSYLNKASLIPMMVSLEISDVVAGVNVERQLSQELNLMLFF
ncbi:transporter [Bdellovibrio sp. HCB337]|uniref:transporter n=1 Tax=Bdellovibrio sp. HCB337 TaxID=3394358 RepID=UPI0039A70FF4